MLERAFRAYPGARRVGPAALLVFLLLAAGAQTIAAEWNYAAKQLAVLQLFPDGAAQARLLFGDEPYNATTRADAVLPRNATILLVTPGLDPRHAEYELFHRLLYRLAPRPVWWTNPAPSDGTWEARWWISSPLDAAALQAIARSKHADAILFYGTAVPAAFGAALELTPHASLVSLGVPLASSELSESNSAFDWNWLGLGIGTASIFALGYALTALAAALGYPMGRIETLALAWALGAGATSVSMLWLNGLEFKLGAQVTIIGAVATAAFLGALIARRRRSVASNPTAEQNAAGEKQSKANPTIAERPDGWKAPRVDKQQLVLILLGSVLASELLYLAVFAVGQPLQLWDGWVNWAIKARIIYRSDGVTANTLFDSSRTVTQPDYPLLVPLVEAWTFHWAGAPDDRLAGIQSVLFFAALLGICYGAVRQFGARRMWALGVMAVLAALPYLNGQAMFAFADLPLAVYATMTGVYLSLWLKTRNAGALLLAAFGAGLLPWTKREGIVLLAAFCLVLLLLYPRRRAVWLAVAACIAAAGVLAGGWWLWVAQENVRNVTFAPLTTATLLANLPRLPNIVLLELLSVLRPEWVLILPLVVLMLVLQIRTLTRAQLLLPLVVFVYLGAMSMGYAFSDFVPYQQHVVSSFDRLLTHVTLLLVVWFAISVPGSLSPAPSPASKLQS